MHRSPEELVMAKIHHEVRIEAPPERVWQLITDPQRLPEYNTTVIEVHDATGPLDQVGARYRTVSRVYGRRIEGPWEVTDVEPNRRLVTRGSAAGGGQVTLIQTLEPADGGSRAAVDIDYELPAGFIGEIANKLFVERALERDVRHTGDNIKAIVEAES
jgi:uncharacterized protein YndB with AHSA1/START domain